MTGLRISALRLANVGVLAGEIDLGTFSDGITLVTGPNETGKSTVVEAVRAALFEKHGAGHAGLKKLQPHGSREAPEVWLDFRIGDARYALHKRFLSGAMAQLSIEAPGLAPEVLTGDAADARIWADLKASAPGNRGAKLENMGVWGLLWVTQDAAAFADPGDALHADTRAALQDIIGRQVSQVLGGAHGERIYARVVAEDRRYWTPTSRNPSGELKAAQDAADAAKARVATIEAKVLEVERQSQDQATLKARADALDAARDELAAEVRSAEDDARAVTRLREAFQLAEERGQTAEERASAAATAVSDRAALADDRRRRDAARAQAAATAANLGEQVAQLDAEVDVAAAALGAADAAAAEARDAWRSARQALATARSARERADARQALAAARELQVRRDALRAEADAALDDAAWRRLTALDAERAEADAELRHTGTRLVVGDAAAPTLTWVVGRRAARAVEGLGDVELTPAAPGLADARAALDAAAERVGEALRPLGVEIPNAARAGRARRAEREAQVADLEARLSALAPAGVEALRSAADKAAADRDALAERLRDARAAEARVAERRAARDALPVDAAALAEVDRLAADRAAREAARAGAATRVTIQPRGAVALTRDGDACPLGEDGAARLTLTRAAVLGIGDVAEVTVEPGGEDLATLERRHAEARAALDAQLESLGVATVEAAREAARARREADDALKEAIGQLGALAPKSVAALAEQSAEATRRAADAQRRRAEADAAADALAAARATLQADPFTADALARLDAALEALGAAQRQVDDRAAALTLAGERVACTAATEGTHAGVRWRVEPGAGGAEAHARRDAKAAALATALAELEAADLDAARARWERGLTVAKTLAEVDRQLAERAPDGLEALAARAGDADADDAVVDDLEPLIDAEQAAERAAEAAETTRDAARRAHQTVTVRRAALAREHAQAEAHAEAAARALTEVETRLAAEREVRDDDALAAEADARRAAAGEAAAALETARVALDAANPALVEGEVERAQGALASHDAQARALRDRVAGLEALLARAAAEGNFEALGDARAELADAEDRLIRVQRDAHAARALFEAVEARYAETQRRFLAPVVQEARPYLQAIRPGTQLQMTPALTVGKVVRAGAEEAFDQLSGGTREQLSVIVRLALARVLARDGTAMPLILDDTMGWTDDGRFLQMTRILRNAAKEMQLIILTCHPGRFARLQPERTIDLEQLRKGALT